MATEITGWRSARTGKIFDNAADASKDDPDNVARDPLYGQKRWGFSGYIEVLPEEPH